MPTDIRSVLALKPSSTVDQYELIVRGDIGESFWYESVAAGDVVAQMDALPASVTQINVRLDSDGGSVADGLSIYNALKRSTARKVVNIEGVAASIASLIAMAGDEIRMPATSVMMVHAPSGPQYGNAQAMLEMAQLLGKFGRTMAPAYAAKTGLSEDEVNAQLLDGTDHFYTGSEAVAAGLADVVEDYTGADAPLAQINASLARFIAAAPQARSVLAIAAAGRLPHVLAVAQPSNPITENRAAKAATTPGVTTMTTSTTATPADPAADAAAIQASAVTALRDRNADIKARLQPYLARPGIMAVYTAALEDPSMTADVACTRAMAVLGATAEPLAGAMRVEMGPDDTDKFRAAGENAILSRAGFAKADGQNPLRGMSMREIARASVTRAGRSTHGMDVREIVATAFTSTSDFPALLTGTARSALLRGYEESAETYPLFTRAGTLTDFRPSSRTGLGFFSGLDKVAEDAEYKYGTFGAAGNAIVLATYGKLFAISRQAIINDDLGAFTEVPRKMGRAAKRTIGDLVFAVLTGNPVMADGVPLFHATHKNLLAAAAPTTASVDAMRVAMGTQKFDSRAINVPLKYLLVPLALQGTAETVRTSQYAVDGSSNTTKPNTVANTFEVIADSRLDAVSASAWYGAADPAMYDTIEVAYLDGVQQPFIDQKDGWTVDGTEFKVRIDAGVAPLDFRGLDKNPGV